MPWKKDSMVSVKVSKETHARLQEHKKKTGVSIVFVMDKAIEEYFERREKSGNG